MPSIDILVSEAKLLETVLKIKEKKLRRAARLIEQAEAEVKEAIDSIAQRAELDLSTTRGTPRLLRDADGQPARIIWRDVVKPKSNGIEQPETEATAAKT
jgi:hypothetical protein